MEQNHNNTSEQERMDEQKEQADVEMSVLGRRLAARAAREQAENNAVENGNTEDRNEGDKPEAASLLESSPALRWLDNFWYHHKWKVIIATFFVIVAVVCTVQFITRPVYDSSVVIASPYQMSKAERADFEALLKTVCADFDGNKKINVNINDYCIYVTDEEIESDEKLFSSPEDPYRVDRSANASRKSNFYNFIKTGETSVCILSRELYTELMSNSKPLMKPLSEIYTDGNLPAASLKDGYGVKLAETDFYKYNPSAQFIPDDAVICVLNPVVFGRNSQEEYYERDVSFFRAIVEFAVSEEETT
jgi:hypothetical protein